MDIKLTTYIQPGSALISRDLAAYIASNIASSVKDDASIYLDFADVGFVSRSFADEFISILIPQSELKNFRLIYINFNQQHSQMFEAVRRTQKPTQRSVAPSPIIKFQTEQDFYNFLQFV